MYPGRSPLSDASALRDELFVDRSVYPPGYSMIIALIGFYQVNEPDLKEGDSLL